MRSVASNYWYLKKTQQPASRLKEDKESKLYIAKNIYAHNFFHAYQIAVPKISCKKKKNYKNDRLAIQEKYFTICIYMTVFFAIDKLTLRK